jgi:hypothetical protein
MAHPRRGPGSDPVIPDSNPYDIASLHNDRMLDDLGHKTEQLLLVTRGVRDVLRDDHAELESLSMSVNRGYDIRDVSRNLLDSVTNEPTYFGVFKIAMLVFWTLCIIYFPGRFVFRYLRG